MSARVTAERPRPTDTGDCGTPRGYARHRARGEHSCRPCLNAANERRMSPTTAGRDAYNAQRREQYLTQKARPAPGPLPSTVGRFAGFWVPHRFRELFPTRGAALCVECFGWPDDVRHL